MGVEKKHGGSRDGSGRKALDPKGTVVMTLRLTQSMYDKVKENGGAEWVRQLIAKATSTYQ